MRSDRIKKGLQQAPARSMLRAVGVGDEDFGRPFVGVVNTFTDGMPCNYHLRQLALDLKAGLREAGVFPFEFGAPAISDGISMGTPGMRASLISREVIADSVELVAQGYIYDGMAVLSACDKTIPGSAMGVIRSGVPGMVLYGGTIAPGEWRGRKLTIVEVFEAVGQRAAGKITDEELLEIERRAIPGPGACGGQYTANTMAMALEALGLSPMGYNAIPAVHPEKPRATKEAGRILAWAIEHDWKPQDFLTRRSFLNAIAAVAATGGSTNAVLHLLAMAKEVGVELSLDDFDRVSRKTPVIADLRPWGTYTAWELYEAGGTPLVFKRLLEAGLLFGEEKTLTGRTLAEEVEQAFREAEGQKVVFPVERALKPQGGLVVLRGNLAPLLFDFLGLEGLPLGLQKGHQVVQEGGELLVLELREAGHEPRGSLLAVEDHQDQVPPPFWRSQKGSRLPQARVGPHPLGLFPVALGAIPSPQPLRPLGQGGKTLGGGGRGGGASRDQYRPKPPALPLAGLNLGPDPVVKGDLGTQILQVLQPGPHLLRGEDGGVLAHLLG
jgi:hypothetical protein